MNPTPVVLVHGIRLTGTMWNSHRDHLALERPAAAVDLPGHGARADRRFGMTAATDAVAEAIDALGGRALVAGISLGGYVGIATAARHPDRVAGLMAIGCTAVPTPASIRPFRVLARLGGGRGQRLQRRLLRLALGRRTAQMACAGGLFNRSVPDVLDAMAAADPLGDLATYPGRVWLVNGSRDHFRADEARFLAACRHGSLAVVPRTGHLVSLTHPDRITAMVETAARQLDRRCADLEGPANDVGRITNLRT